MYEKLSLKELVDEAIKVNATAQAMIPYLLGNQYDFESTCKMQILTGKSMLLGGLINLKVQQDPSDEATEQLRRYTKALQGRMEIYE